MAYTFAGYHDYFERGPWVPYMRARRAASGTPVQMVELEQPAGAFPDPPMPDLSIQLCTKGVFNGEVDMGLGRRNGRFGPGSIIVAPPNAAADYVLDRPHGLLVLAVPFAEVRDILDQAAAGHRGDFGLLHDLPFYDPVISHLCLRMWEEAEADNPRGRLFAEGALVALVTALLRRHDPSAAPLASARPGVKAHLRRALDYLEAHLDEEVSLADLATVAGLRVTHFARAFKEATGVAPYRYLMARRVERARTLLATTSLPIAQIALDCGFCHQEHLTTMFRRATGVTPLAYRRDAGH